MNKTSIFEQLARIGFLPLYTKVITASLQLDIYSHLSKEISAETLANQMGWHKLNTSYLLEGLTAIGFVEKNGDTFP